MFLYIESYASNQLGYMYMFGSVLFIHIFILYQSKTSGYDANYSVVHKLMFEVYFMKTKCDVHVYLYLNNII